MSSSTTIQNMSGWVNTSMPIPQKVVHPSQQLFSSLNAPVPYCMTAGDLAEYQVRLVHLYHAANCDDSNATPPRPCRTSRKCVELAVLLHHVQDCKNYHCKMPDCITTRNIIDHYRGCNDNNCVLCKPVNENNHRKKARLSEVRHVHRRPSPSINESVNQFEDGGNCVPSNVGNNQQKYQQLESQPQAQPPVPTTPPADYSFQNQYVQQDTHGVAMVTSKYHNLPTQSGPFYGAGTNLSPPLPPMPPSMQSGFHGYYYNQPQHSPQYPGNYQGSYDSWPQLPQSSGYHQFAPHNFGTLYPHPDNVPYPPQMINSIPNTDQSQLTSNNDSMMDLNLDASAEDDALFAQILDNFGTSSLDNSKHNGESGSGKHTNHAALANTVAAKLQAIASANMQQQQTNTIQSQMARTYSATPQHSCVRCNAMIRHGTFCYRCDSCSMDVCVNCSTYIQHEHSMKDIHLSLLQNQRCN